MTLTVRYMTVADIPQVIPIDRASFSTPWSPRTYAYEIGESEYSHMMVVEQTLPPPRANGLRRMIQNFLPVAPPPYQIVAYGGLWRMLEEAHISTIASHPDWRGSGFGEIALAAMMRRALTLNASYVALEVRVNNQRAQNLYFKYGFKISTIKPRYYRDNGEDAYDMRLMLNDQVCHDFERQYAALQQKYGFIDRYTMVTRRT